MKAVARGSIKCVVWDLDDTLWDGVLLEDGEVTLRPGVADVLRTLDGRGILHSIASRNDEAAAMARLKSLGIADLFLYPQIGWRAKSASVAAVAKALDIGLDAVAFVDDQGFERKEVRFALPSVTCFDAAEAISLPDRPELTPRFITEDSARRRTMYLSDRHRTAAEEEFSGTDEAFLATLGMVLTVAPAGEHDLARAEELTVRTNQLNTTGRPYSYEELDALRVSSDHLLLVAGLEDRFGTYGKIGLSLIERGVGTWSIQLLLVSCRVMSRGVGAVLLGEIMRRAKAAGVRLVADFVENDRNRMMYLTYRFAGFREVHRDGPRSVLEASLHAVGPAPPYVDLRVTPWVA